MNSKVSLKPEFQSRSDSKQKSHPAEKLGGFFVRVVGYSTSAT